MARLNRVQRRAQARTQTATQRLRTVVAQHTAAQKSGAPKKIQRLTYKGVGQAPYPVEMGSVGKGQVLHIADTFRSFAGSRNHPRRAACRFDWTITRQRNLFKNSKFCIRCLESGGHRTQFMKLNIEWAKKNAPKRPRGG